MNTWNTCKNRLAVALTLLGLVACASPQAGLAQVDVGACGVYSSQAEAQADLDANPDLAADLDGDGNGIACEGGYAGDNSPGTGPVDVGACGVYSSQAEAQADLDANPDLAADLDGDGNGIACEGGYAGDTEEDNAGAEESAVDNADDDAAVSALPSTGSGPAMMVGNQLTQVASAFALLALAGFAGGFHVRRVLAGR